MTNPENPENPEKTESGDGAPDAGSTASAGESGARPIEPIEQSAPAAAPAAAGGAGDKKKWLIGGAVAAGAAVFLIGFGCGYITGDQVGGTGDRPRGISQDGRDRGGDPMLVGPRGGSGREYPGQRGQTPNIPMPDQQAPTGETQQPTTSS
ncbi:hypothetical protein [Gordonia caeni]|uniref:Uncharacterized protein n=1 Tax=Gordonia caeni TaxID=1007097 RepID=A0ABP7PQ96_9ACTN